MDVYSFIDHRGIADHCRKIGQTWTAFEMAVIIGYCQGRTVAEKHAAWRELIENYPDMPTLEHYNYSSNPNFVSYSSLHKKLAETIEYEEAVAALFMKQEEGATYKYSRHEAAFPSFEEAWAAARQQNRASTNIMKYYNGGLSAPGTYGWYDIEAVFDMKGNPHWYRMSGDAQKKFFLDADYLNENHRFSRLFGGFISSRMFGDRYSFAMLDGTFYVYIPNPHLDSKLLLNESERLFLYKILRTFDEFDMLFLNFMAQPSNYSPEAWRVFRVFTTGGGEDELNTYWEEFIVKMTGHIDDPELKEFKRVREELTGELLKLAKERFHVL